MANSAPAPRGVGCNKEISGKRGRNKVFLLLSTKKRGRYKEMVEGRNKEFWPKYLPLYIENEEPLNRTKNEPKTAKPQTCGHPAA